MLSLLALAVAASPALAAAPANGVYNNATGSPVIEVIESAVSTLDIEMYEMDDPVVINAIENALRRGVVVHIVKEPSPVGASCKVFGGGKSSDPSDGGASCAQQTALVSEVNQAGGAYVPFSKAAFCGGSTKTTCLEHGKIVVADSNLAMISTGNLNTTNLCDTQYSPGTCNRDYSFITNSPDVAQSLQRVVEYDIRGQSYDPASVLTQAASQDLTVGPNSLSPIVNFINSAQHSIQIQNQYLEEPNINNALMQAAERGVQVQVNVASFCAFGRPSASEVNKYTQIFNAFDSAGITSRAFNKRMIVGGLPGYLHAKAIVIDQQSAWVGSENGSTQGMTENREFGIFFHDASDVQGLSQVMSADFNDPNEETWQDSLNCAENG